MRQRLHNRLRPVIGRGVPERVDASSPQRAVAAAAFGVAMSASAIAQDLTSRPGRIYRGATGPAQVLQPAGFISDVESDVGIGVSAWPRLPKRRIGGTVV